MLKNILVIFVMIFTITACTITQTVEPTELSKQNQLCIINNPAVKEGFLEQFEAVLSKNEIAHIVVDESDIPSSCDWTATYTANWKWDMAVYMVYAEIKVFYNGNLDGEAVYDARKGDGNMSKFIDANEKIEELLNELLRIKTASLFSRHFG